MTGKLVLSLQLKILLENTFLFEKSEKICLERNNYVAQWKKIANINYFSTLFNAGATHVQNSVFLKQVTTQTFITCPDQIEHCRKMWGKECYLQIKFVNCPRELTLELSAVQHSVC